MNMIIGNRYNWKNQPVRLIYMGTQSYPGNGTWYQFALVDKPSVCWCEVRKDDLAMFEETKEVA